MEAPQAKDTQAFDISPDPLDAGLAAAFGPDSDHPLPAGASVLQALSASLPAVPCVHLREPREDQPTPVVRPQSSAMPEDAHLPDSSSRYQLVGELARGGMGVILKGRDIDLGRDIALKVLLDSHQDKPELVQRFLEEAQIAGQLQHPGVVPVYELGQFGDGRPYFTMKLVTGKTLAALLAARPKPAAERSKFVGIFVQVCQTLAYAHARGVIHRDLKPSNVMVGAFGEVQLMDWGLAKVLSEGGSADEEKSRLRQEGSVIHTQRSTGSHTQAGSVLGTPAYMAPEQARGEVDLVDERADVFGLGAILCEILTGQPPFVGKRAEAQRKAQTAQLDDTYERLAQCGADAQLADTKLIALARRCLAAEPRDRPRDAGVVAEQLTAYLESVQARLRRVELEQAVKVRAREEAHTQQLAEAKAGEERKRRWAMLALAAAVLLLPVVLQISPKLNRITGHLGKATEWAAALALWVLGSSGAAWWWQQRTERVRAVEAALAAAARHQQKGQWAEVRAALEQAEGQLGGGGAWMLRQRVRQARTDAEMVAELDEIRLRQAEVKEGRFDIGGADGRYAEAFQKYGIDVEALEVKAAAKRLRGSAICEELLAALDNWTWSKPKDDPEREQLRAVADGADANSWRRAFREAAVQGDVAQLKEQAGQAEALEQLPAALSLFGKALMRAGLEEEGVTFLRRAQQRYPGDFWVNHDLANHLRNRKPPRLDEAVGYYRACLALRPGSPSVQVNLGNALQAQGDLVGASACYRKAVQLEPKYSGAHYHLGNVLRRQRDLAGASACYRKAIQLDPKLAGAHINLGLAWHSQGKFTEALTALKEGARWLPAEDPNWPSVRQHIRRTERLVELEPHLSALLSGQQKPAKAAERIEYAKLCYYKQLFAASARFFADALVEQPQLADNLQTRYGYAAARAAAVAGAGKGQDVPPPDDVTKAQLRQQARAWLQADLAAYAKRLDSEDPQAPNLVRRRLTPWKYDPQLAGLRNEDALQKLPAEERAACRKLWADVESVLQRAADR